MWLRLAKKGTVEPTRLGYGEALEHALCFGWIDGQVRRFDEATFKQRFNDIQTEFIEEPRAAVFPRLPAARSSRSPAAAGRSARRTPTPS